MRIGIVGAGNIGSSLVRCFAAKGIEVCISNPSTPKLDAIKDACPTVETTVDNIVAVKGADVVFLAVKPYLIETVLKQVSPVLTNNQIVVSVAAGIGTDKLEALTRASGSPVFYVIPNTAISKGESMSFYCSARADAEQEQVVFDLLSLMGSVLKVQEEKMGAYISLSSCGIAYALRYIRAAMCGAVEMGIKPSEAEAIICQTLKGAVSLLEDGSHPEAEIDKVTTPGGLTIKGLDAMEAAGFTNSVIEGLRASKK